MGRGAQKRRPEWRIETLGRGWGPSLATSRLVDRVVMFRIVSVGPSSLSSNGDPLHTDSEGRAIGLCIVVEQTKGVLEAGFLCRTRSWNPVMILDKAIVGPVQSEACENGIETYFCRRLMRPFMDNAYWDLYKDFAPSMGSPGPVLRHWATLNGLHLDEPVCTTSPQHVGPVGIRPEEKAQNMLQQYMGL